MTPDPVRRVLLFLPLLASAPSAARADALALPTLMARLASVAERRARFREERRFAALSGPLESRGTLLYRRPDYLEKNTEWPSPERMVVDGGRLVITEPGNDPPRVIDLTGQPELRAATEGIRDPLAGDLPALARAFDVAAAGTLGSWTLLLTPRDPAVAKVLQRVQLAGADSWIAEVRTAQSNGDEQWMRIEPA